MEVTIQKMNWIISLLLAFQAINAKGYGLSSFIIWPHSENHRASTCSSRSGYYFDLTYVPSATVGHRLKRSADQQPKVVVKSLIIDSQIVTRFGETVISSEVENTHETNIDTSFTVQIPETAFISNFTMVIDGVKYTAEVKSKEEAQKMFDEAKKKNKTAGMVSAKPPEPEMAQRAMEVFTVKVTVKSNSTVSFELTYLEALVRKQGVFEHRISVRPKQIVERLAAKVLVHEPQGIKQLDVFEPSATSNNVVNQHTNIQDLGSTRREINYTPDQMSQTQFPGNHGISGDLVTRYDVNHAYDIGSVQVQDGYFVHHFSPDENQMTVLSKNLIFVIDISGSMSGKKIEQTREAMLAMLNWLNNGDRFMIILFDDSLVYWPDSKTLMPADSQTVANAKYFVREKVVAQGSTNINDALVDAGNRLRELVSGGNTVLFLTDGMPTAGETNPSMIIRNVVEATGGKSSVYSLGFGFNLNFELLQSISYRTEGYSVRIYEEADAEKQLTDFFLQINNPLLFNINFEYSPGNNNVVVVDEITQTSFSNYFKGSELTVAGKLKESAPQNWQVKVVAKAGSIPFEMQKHINLGNMVSIYSQEFIEKLFVYLKIKDLLREELTIDDATTKSAIKQKALELALHNNLVTPLTSMIIVQNSRPESPDFLGGSVRDSTTFFKASSTSIITGVHYTYLLIFCALYMHIIV